MASMLDWRNPTVVDELMQHDVIVLERNMVTQEVHDLIRYIQGMGKTVVLDWDDSYEHLPWSNPAHSFWKLNKGN